MKVKAQFTVQDIFEISDLGIGVMIKQNNDVDFKASNKSKLNGIEISNWNFPRKLDSSGDESLNTWVAILKNDVDRNKFSLGQVVELN